jgi:putative transcriptional regulator
MQQLYLLFEIFFSIMETNHYEREMIMGFSYDPLWHLLLDKKMTKTQFREQVGIGTAQLAKMGKGEYVSMEVLDKICSYFGVQPNDIIKHVRQ